MRIWYANVFVVIALGLQCEAEAQGVTDSRAAGEAFLEENAQREGVVTLPSGLQYEVSRGRRRRNTETAQHGGRAL